MARNRLLAILKTRFFWINMHTHICDWVNACIKCKQIKPDRALHNGLLIPIKTSSPFEIVGIDIVGPFHLTKNRNRYILVCIDLFTNWIEVSPLKTVTAEEVANVFYKLIITRHGCPQNVLSDQGTQFTSGIFKNLCKQFNIKHIETTAYHQQCNGKAERFIRFLCKSIATMLNESQTNWDELIDCCVFIYRTSVSRVLNDSPFYMLYARDPVLPQDLMFPLKRKEREEDDDTYKIEHLKKLRSAYDKLIATKQEYQQQYKSRYDQTHKHIEFNIDDYAMVYFPATQIGKTTKFLPILFENLFVSRCFSGCA